MSGVQLAAGFEGGTRARVMVLEVGGARRVDTERSGYAVCRLRGAREGSARPIPAHRSCASCVVTPVRPRERCAGCCLRERA
eukprot:1399738-Prymnesium_polylepis.1